MHSERERELMQGHRSTRIIAFRQVTTQFGDVASGIADRTGDEGMCLDDQGFVSNCFDKTIT